MWIWRQMEKISWRYKISIDDVLKRVNEERSLLNEIWQQKHRWIGRMVRHDSFLQGIFEGRMLGKRTRGRRRDEWALFKQCIMQMVTRLSMLPPYQITAG